MAAIERVARGDAVRARGERWTVRHVTAYDTAAVVELAGAEASNAGMTRRLLLPHDSIEWVPRAADRVRVVRRRTWRRVARRVLAAATPGWTALQAPARANLELLPYQLEPALAMTRGMACRILLADAVGLGKTVQAGLAIAEVLARERDARILIVTPAGLREQWRDELHRRFALDAAVVDAGALTRATAALPAGANPWAALHLMITSIDFLKRPEIIRSLEPLSWDLVAFDEAHALCGRSDRARAAELLAARARRLVLITATPHDGDDAAFERLRALGRLGDADPLLTFRRARSDVGIPDRRAVRRIRVTATRDEARMHRALAAYADRVAADAPPGTAAAARLAMIVLSRRASSSAASLARSIERRIALLGGACTADAQMRLPLDDDGGLEDDEPIAELSAPGLPEAAEERQWLERVLSLARAVQTESKLRALARLLARAGEPALVFTEYRDTLQQVLAALGGGAAVLHGGLTARERAAEARRFTHGDARVLLATDAASEGLNLHHRCRLVINLDVPWTPLRLEQRVGRVDRLGQARRVHAVVLMARATAEERTASALSDRSLRAARDAPFGLASSATALAEDARREAARLRVVRLLSCGASDRPCGSRRPALTLTPRGAGRLTLAIALPFVDCNGAVIWEATAGLAVAAGPPERQTAAAVRNAVERAVGERAIPLASLAATVHAALLRAVRGEIEASTSSLVVRERAMLAWLQERYARLAAGLVQPGLFETRAVRHAAAQRRVMEDAAAAAAGHLRALERRCDARAGRRTLLFALLTAR